MSQPNKEEWWTKNRKTLLHVACSGELTSRLQNQHELSTEIVDLSNEYTAYTESELYLTNEYYQLQMNNIEKEFFKKQREYWNHYVNLRLIISLPVYLN